MRTLKSPDNAANAQPSNSFFSKKEEIGYTSAMETPPSFFSPVNAIQRLAAPASFLQDDTVAEGQAVLSSQVPKHSATTPKQAPAGKATAGIGAKSARTGVAATAGAGHGSPVQPPATTITAVLTPRDNFPGRSTTRYGVGEQIDLSFTNTATGPAPTGTGEEWFKRSGSGTVVNSGANDGRALFTAGDRHGHVVLDLKAVGGTNAGAVLATKQLTIVEPNNAVMRQASGTHLRHSSGMAGVGFKGSIFARPMNVSFSRVEMREGSVTGVGTGFYSMLNGRVHQTTPSYIPFGPSNSATGNQLVGNDTVDTGDNAGPFSAGTFNWPIPWQFRVGTGTPKVFTTATHSMSIDAVGTTSIRKKGAGPFTKHVTDATSAF